MSSTQKETFKNTNILTSTRVLRVVGISKNFNDDMQEYIDRIYGKKERYVPPKPSKKAKHKPVPRISEEEIYVEYDEQTSIGSWFSNIFKRRPKNTQYQDDLDEETTHDLENIEEEIEEVSEEIEDLEEKREGLFQRFFTRMRSARMPQADIQEDVVEDVPVIDAEVRELLKTLHKWLERLPPRELKSFKMSNDFQQYREVLEKYKLIKKD